MVIALRHSTRVIDVAKSIVCSEIPNAVLSTAITEPKSRINPSLGLKNRKSRNQPFSRVKISSFAFKDRLLETYRSGSPRRDSADTPFHHFVGGRVAFVAIAAFSVLKLFPMDSLVAPVDIDLGEPRSPVWTKDCSR